MHAQNSTQHTYQYVYGTLTVNFPYTQHKLFAYMTQAWPAFHTHSTNCLPVWHKHGQPSIHTAQTVCLYGTSMANLLYTQHKLFAYMAQAWPTFHTHSTNCLPVWHKHGQPSVHSTNCLTIWHKHGQPSVHSTNCLPIWHMHGQPSVHSTNCLPIWHKHGQPSVHTAQTVCLYGTSMANLPYTQHKLFACMAQAWPTFRTQHKLFACMAQAWPTFHTHSTNCLPIWHKHGQPSVHSTNCLPVWHKHGQPSVHSTNCLPVWHKHGQPSVHSTNCLPVWHKHGQPSVHSTNCLPVWHKHGQPSIHTAQTVCLYGTSMANLLYTQHKLFAYMAQAWPTFHGTSMTNLPYTQHKLPYTQHKLFVCLLVSNIMDITSVSLQLRVMQSSPQIWLQMSKSNVQALYCIYIYLQALGTPTCYAMEENPPKSGHSTYP